MTCKSLVHSLVYSYLHSSRYGTLLPYFNFFTANTTVSECRLGIFGSAVASVWHVCIALLSCLTSQLGFRLILKTIQFRCSLFRFQYSPHLFLFERELSFKKQCQTRPVPHSSSLDSRGTSLLSGILRAGDVLRLLVVACR